MTYADQIKNKMASNVLNDSNAYSLTAQMIRQACQNVVFDIFMPIEKKFQFNIKIMISMIHIYCFQQSKVCNHY